MSKTRAKKIKAEWTAADVLEALSLIYADKEKGTFLTDVSNATSFNRDRAADAIYMGAWQSVGIQCHGFEVKVSRGDWLREIQDVSKAGAFEKFCHFWWIVAPEGIVELAEMPVQWGLKEITRKDDSSCSIRVKKAASRNPNASLDYHFFASCLRKCRREDATAIEIQQLKDAAYRDGFKNGQEHKERPWESEHLRREVGRLQSRINNFQEKSGIRIDEWNAGEIGEIVRHIESHGIGEVERLKMIRTWMEESIVALNSFMNAANALTNQESQVKILKCESQNFSSQLESK